MSAIRRVFVGEGRARHHRIEAGEGPGSLLIFPAVGDTANSYARTLPALAEALRGALQIAAIDPPGYGRALLPNGEIPTFSELMAWAGELGRRQTGPTLFAGNSSGGAMATAAAVAGADKTRGLALIGWPDWRVAEMPMRTLLPGDRDELSALLERSWHAPPTMPADMADILLVRYTAPQFQTHVRSLCADEVLGYYDAYRGPLLFVGGSADRLVPPDALKKSAARRTSADVQVLESCGHFPHRERTDDLVEVLTRFATACLK